MMIFVVFVTWILKNFATFIQGVFLDPSSKVFGNQVLCVCNLLRILGICNLSVNSDNSGETALVIFIECKKQEEFLGHGGGSANNINKSRAITFRVKSLLCRILELPVASSFVKINVDAVVLVGMGCGAGVVIRNGVGEVMLATSKHFLSSSDPELAKLHAIR